MVKILILVEGPDGSGKSNLVADLVKTIEFQRPRDTVEVLHKGPPTKSLLDEYETPLLEYRPGRGHHIICDRWHLGEWIYPQILGRDSDADDGMLWHIEAFLRSRGAMLVHTTLQTDLISSNIARRGDDLVTVLQTAEIMSGYMSMVRRTQLPLWTYDYTAHDATFASMGIVASAEAAEKNAEILNPFVTYVGPRRPSLLLFGEVRHEVRDFARRVDPAATIGNGVAFGPARGTSGYFLLRHLTSGTRQIMGVANACDVDDAEKLWTALGFPTMVALGRSAYDAVRVFFPEVGAVPHPQYVRRFHKASGNTYARLIADVARNPRDEIGWRPAKAKKIVSTREAA